MSRLFLYLYLLAWVVVISRVLFWNPVAAVVLAYVGYQRGWQIGLWLYSKLK